MDITEQILQDVEKEIEENKFDFDKMKRTAIKANLNTKIAKAVNSDEMQYLKRERDVYFFFMAVFLAATLALSSALILTK